MFRLDTDDLGNLSGFRICEIGDSGVELVLGPAALPEADGTFGILVWPTDVGVDGSSTTGIGIGE